MNLDMNTANLLDGLNDQQKQAALQTEGPLLILAGAGSGKTTVLVARTGQIIKKNLAKPSEILVLTFTNKAAKELNERVSHKLSLGRKEKIWTGTFHGFGLDFLKRNYKEADLPKKFGLIDSADSRFILKELLKNKTHSDKSGFDLEILQTQISNLRAGKKLSPDVAEAYKEMAEWLLPEYLLRMHTLGVIDFDGLILKPLELLRANENLKAYYQKKFKYIMVDEFQDTNKMQMDLVSELIDPETQNIGVVGDDDQSIYGWRGAEIKNILTFPKLFENCKVVRLETNYRSTPQILELANSVISSNENRHKKILKPHASSGEGGLPEVFLYKNEDAECEEIVSLIRNYRRKYNYDDIAVLFRSNAQGGVLEGLLRQERIPYDLTGGPALIDRKEVRDVLSFLKAAFFPNDISIRRILNVPSRGIGDQSVHKIIDYQKEHNLDFIKALKHWKNAEVQERTGEAIEGFFNLLKTIRLDLLQPNLKFAEALPRVFSTEIKYKDMVIAAYKDGATAMKKWQLVEVLGRILDGFIKKTEGSRTEAIKDFIDALSLREQDLNKKDDEKKVQLLTFHASKGLEFPVVILMGVDEGLIPHESLGHDVSEERRLFYVGVTRAKKELVLTRAAQRKRYGKLRNTSASRFLEALPKDLYRFYESGIKPITESERVSMLSDLYKTLDEKSKEQSLD